MGARGKLGNLKILFPAFSKQSAEQDWVILLFRRLESAARPDPGSWPPRAAREARTHGATPACRTYSIHRHLSAVKPQSLPRSGAAAQRPDAQPVEG
jgi:hypothetical protein